MQESTDNHLEEQDTKEDFAENQLLVLGSLNYDSISTPFGSIEKTLGGSANYAALGASFCHDFVSVAGSIGTDYTDNDFEKLAIHGVNHSHLFSIDDLTAHWKGTYSKDLNHATTLNEADFIKAFSKHCEDFIKALDGFDFPFHYILLGNTDPNLQMAIFKKIEDPLLVGFDTRDAWLLQRDQTDCILKVLQHVDILFVNEEEGRILSKKQNIAEVANDLLELGPEVVIIKRGEYGFLLYYQNEFLALPAFPLQKVMDTTGAGDVFAGAVMGFLADANFQFDQQLLGQACLYGTVLASYVVEGFGMTSLQNKDIKEVQKRLEQYKSLISFEKF